MKRKITILTLLTIVFCCYSCNYLDIVPDELPTEEDAFNDRYAAERYLYSCYSHLPNQRNGGVWLMSTTEVASSLEQSFLQGRYSATAPGYYTYWSICYGAIRRCYLLIDNIDSVPRLDEETKENYKAEARFLIAYYHFLLLRAYGPIPIVEKAYDLDTEIAEFPPRSNFDKCVQWISDLYDYAYNGLLEQQPTNYYGRATRPAAKTLKALLWLYAASPLFNGNTEFYSDSLIDPETGEHLMPQNYDANKWKKALQYALEAETSCNKNGIKPYDGNPDDPDTGEMPYPSNIFEWRARMTYIDRNTNELIWADTRRESTYDLQNNATPYDNTGHSWSNIAPTLETVKRFYTENGLPIDVDPAYYSQAEWMQTDSYEGELTAKLHLKREPRFYAWISFHNGWYEMQKGDAKRIRTSYRKNDTYGIGSRDRDYSMTGYLMKKSVSPSYNTMAGLTQFPFPIIRLSELYLIIAEAAAEAGELETAKNYLNKVRTKAGIPTVEESWKKVPGVTLDQNKLIEIIRQERLIELFMEGNLLWDVKRWKVAEQYVKTPTGLNIMGATDEEFFQETPVSLCNWSFNSPTNYLLPIPEKDVNVVRRLVQNPGY
ncbi:hypothetical protein B5G09_11415 [Alistipes sp. An54]|uniref:RagB/SusD family nutrient uptake outer membrane protein n=1 Tax=Alistipes sp. An54 TaxID=1965645 RepID=UPI000B3ACF7D|nr:RagB/SusD family nutrient uptake outer membrane protein [Alistipes sp. An54]OUN76135.1 hypothetical protein B5G09_11415 [Alistipes sp. An54]